MTAVSPVNVPTARRPSFYERVCALGFALIALGSLVALGWGLATGSAGDALAFALPVVVVGLLIAGAVWRWGRWALVVAAVLSLLLLALVVPFSLFSLGHPESGADFIPVVLASLGAGLGLVGSGVALVQWRRRTVRANPTRAERLLLSSLLGVVALTVLFSAVLTLTSRTALAAEAKAGAVSVHMKNFSFTPNTLEIQPGQTVRVVVSNEDATLHTFTMPGAGVDVSVPPGSEKIVEFQAPASGTYQWYCLPHSSPSGSTRTGMVGTLQVP